MYSAIEPRCPERSCIAALRGRSVVAGAPRREGSIETQRRAAEKHTVTVQYPVLATAVVGLVEGRMLRFG